MTSPFETKSVSMGELALVTFHFSLSIFRLTHHMSILLFTVHQLILGCSAGAMNHLLGCKPNAIQLLCLLSLFPHCDKIPLLFVVYCLRSSIWTPPLCCLHGHSEHATATLSAPLFRVSPMSLETLLCLLASEMTLMYMRSNLSRRVVPAPDYHTQYLLDLFQAFNLLQFYSLFSGEEVETIRCNISLLQMEIRVAHRQALDASHHGFQCLVTEAHGSTGHPRFIIDESFLCWAYTHRSTSGIAAFLGVSRPTVRKALLDYGIVEPGEVPIIRLPVDPAVPSESAGSDGGEIVF